MPAKQHSSQSHPAVHGTGARAGCARQREEGSWSDRLPVVFVLVPVVYVVVIVLILVLVLVLVIDVIVLVVYVLVC